MRYSYYEINQDKGCLGKFIAILSGVIICLIITLCTSSCKTVKEYDYSKDSTYISKVEYSALKDSLSNYRLQMHNLVKETNKKDSVYNSHSDSTIVFIKGDSTIIEHWYRDIVYKESNVENNTFESLLDSLSTYKGSMEFYISKLDSIQASSKEHKEVVMQKYIPTWVKYILGILSFFTLIILLGFFIRLKFKG